MRVNQAEYEAVLTDRRRRMAADWAALREACNDYHRKTAGGPCGQVQCVCGRTGSSAACAAIHLLRAFFRHLDDADLDAIGRSSHLHAEAARLWREVVA